jgi:hypothetical protein
MFYLPLLTEYKYSILHPNMNPLSHLNVPGIERDQVISFSALLSAYKIHEETNSVENVTVINQMKRN